MIHIRKGHLYLFALETVVYDNFHFSFLIILYHLLSPFDILNYTIFVKHQKCLTADPEKIQQQRLKYISAGAETVQQQIAIKLVTALQELARGTPCNEANSKLFYCPA